MFRTECNASAQTAQNVLLLTIECLYKWDMNAKHTILLFSCSEQKHLDSHKMDTVMCTVVMMFQPVDV